MKFRGKAAIVGLVLCFALVTTGLAAEKGFMWDGTHWKDLGQELKVAYIKGVGNMADFEAGTAGTSRAACISKALVSELKTKAIAQVVQEVDNYYQQNPSKMSTPVLEVILRSSTKLCPPEAPAQQKKN
jgi:hypothetical protein